MKKVRGEKRVSDMLANFDFGNYEIKICLALKRLGKKELRVIEINCRYGGNNTSWMNEIIKSVSENGFHPLWAYSIQEVFVGLKTKKELKRDCECGCIWSACSGKFVEIVSYERRRRRPDYCMGCIMPPFFGPPHKYIKLEASERVSSAKEIAEIALDRGECLCRFEMRE
jgi:hypothetical protein